jgi:hypothetical protein
MTTSLTKRAAVRRVGRALAPLAAGATLAPRAARAAPPPGGAFADAFTAPDGTALTAHNPAWATGARPWEIQSGRAQIKLADPATTDTAGIATVATGGGDHEVAARITLPGTTPRWPVDWFCGLYARYLDGANLVHARYLYQDDSPEVELWEIAAGVARRMSFVNLGRGALPPGSTHTLRLQTRGGQVLVFHDDQQVLQGGAKSRGTRVGMGASGNPGFGSGQAQWDDFRATW